MHDEHVLLDSFQRLIDGDSTREVASEVRSSGDA